MDWFGPSMTPEQAMMARALAGGGVPTHYGPNISAYDILGTMLRANRYDGGNMVKSQGNLTQGIADDIYNNMVYQTGVR